MRKLCLRGALAAAIVLAFGTSSITTRASDGDVAISARTRGLGEVPPTNSKATAEFKGAISADGTTITYTLTWSGLTTLPLFSHIHFGPSKENGGVMVLLCGGGGGFCNPNNANHSELLLIVVSSGIRAPEWKPRTCSPGKRASRPARKDPRHKRASSLDLVSA